MFKTYSKSMVLPLGMRPPLVASVASSSDEDDEEDGRRS
jgi:hypothetical protein